VGLAELAASGVIILVPFLLTALWIWGDPTRRVGLVATSIAAAVALGTNQVLGLLWFEPRPFMIGLGRTLITHPPENSFPSDHTTFMLTVGFGLIATRAAATWGKIVIILGLLVAWARIYLGLHFPVDMVASGLVGGCFGGGAAFLLPLTRRWVMPLLNPFYEAGLRVLHLPARVFPRQF
jgi:undecaprenyl-diphosphatase